MTSNQEWLQNVSYGQKSDVFFEKKNELDLLDYILFNTSAVIDLKAHCHTESVSLTLGYLNSVSAYAPDDI